MAESAPASDRQSAASEGRQHERGDRKFASARDRAVAYLADAVVLGPVLLRVTRGWSLGRRLLGIVGLASLYHVLLEGVTGQTPGKRAVGITVTGAGGGPVGLRPAAVRTAWRAVDWLPLGYLLGVVAIVATDQNQRLGDRAADTVVLRREPPARDTDEGGR